MANTNAPFGFQPVTNAGGPQNFRISVRRIASGNATAIYKGDAVVPVTSTLTGYIAQATASTVELAGIFWGCKYLSTSQKRTVWSNYWPGADTAYDVEAYVIDDPNARFLVQTAATGYAVSNTANIWTSAPALGKNFQLNVGTGSTATGLSGMYADTVGTTSTYPFKMVDFWYGPPGSNGSDVTSAYCWIVCQFNNEAWRSNGAVTGPS
jgi:hypothetical protein